VKGRWRWPARWRGTGTPALFLVAMLLYVALVCTGPVWAARVLGLGLVAGAAVMAVREIRRGRSPRRCAGGRGRHRSGQPRWVPVIVGQESGQVSALPFPEFRSEAEGEAWCDRMNHEHDEAYPAQRDRPLTRFEFRRLDDVSGLVGERPTGERGDPERPTDLPDRFQ
jgi:hypothetical protein